jgi:uracil-DNA glycosylase
VSQKIAIIGEAWGEVEERMRLPFQGPAGYELNRMLTEAGIDRSDCYLATVFNVRPTPTLDIENLCAPRGMVSHNLPALRPGKYIRDEFLPEIDRLRQELADCAPNLVICMGNTAAWAMLSDPRISKIRGTISYSDWGYKVLPTYHPSAILRQWELRHVTVLDLMKAKREAEFPDVRRPKRLVYVPETLQDMEAWYERIAALPESAALAVDIETKADQITCIGFAPSHTEAFVIPIWDDRRGGSYWSTLTDELQAWRIVRQLCATRVRKVFQNGLYDLHYIWRRYGITCVNAGEDTMLLHHALHPESEKGLGFLGSVYTNEPAWKLMRKHGKQHYKREDE